MTDPTPVTPALLREWPLPEPGEDKKERGRILVAGGSTQTPGAVRLAGEAALRAGAGTLQLATAAAVAPALAVAVPEALVLPLPHRDDGVLDRTAAARLADAAAGLAVLLGPGLLDVDATTELLEEVVPALDGPLVLDALGTAYLTAHPEGMRRLAGRCVLTVNPGEVAHVLGRDEDAVTEDPVAAAKDAAARTGAVVLLGSTTKTVAEPGGRVWSERIGNPGLGVSGSGDVQAGLVAGLLARGAEPAQAAVWGAHLHGAAGEVLADRTGGIGYLARDLAPVVPGLLAQLS